MTATPCLGRGALPSFFGELVAKRDHETLEVIEKVFEVIETSVCDFVIVLPAFQLGLQSAR